MLKVPAGYVGGMSGTASVGAGLRDGRAQNVNDAKVFRHPKSIVRRMRMTMTMRMRMISKKRRQEGNGYF
jgi:hypothetical protein